ncbi:MAG: hypothetical protein WDW38_002649 [Sanguina aurantia]
MLRALARHVRSLKVVSDAAPAAFNMRHMSSGHDEEEDAKPRTGPVPTVFDRLVSFTVIDLTGKRHIVRGLQGKNLSEVLQEHGFPRTYFFPNMGFYTQHIPDCHVFIPKDLWAHIPNIAPDSACADAIKRMFRDIVQDYQKDSSYFGTYVPVSAHMEGTTIGIGPIKPWILHPGWLFDGVHDTKETQFNVKAIEIWG